MSEYHARPTLDERHVPADLRERPQWVTWREESRRGRPTKVPCRPDGRGLARVNDPSTWGAFDEAFATSRCGSVDGLGFVFTEGDPFVGVDLDDCVAAGRLHPAAAAIVERLDSYTEFSPSVRGVHLIACGSLGEGSRHRTTSPSWGGPIEIYDHRRYFTVTGHRVPGTRATIELRQLQLDALIGEFLGDTRSVMPTPPLTLPLGIDDERLLKLARSSRRGDSFRRLYDHGDHSGYASPSHADLALAGTLAFWTGRDPERINRLFRASALYRPKWDERRGETTYGAMTIAAAIERCRNSYTPRGTWPSEVRIPGLTV